MTSLLERAAQVLQARQSEIASAVEARIYGELASYPSAQLPAEESLQTAVEIIGFVIRNLGDASTSEGLLHSIVPELMQFQEGIAAQRVHYRVRMVDILHGVRFLRDEVWAELRAALVDELDGQTFFELQGRIDALFDYLIAGLAEAYLEAQQRIITDQQSALDKWEEVVKSASSIELKIPCQSEYVSIARLQAEAIARRVGYSDEEVRDIVYAVGEAADNSIEHGFSDKGVEIRYQLSPARFCIEITDFGPGFDPTARAALPLDPFAEDGRGLFMMSALMDGVDISSGPSGTRVTAFKTRLGQAGCDPVAVCSGA